MSKVALFSDLHLGIYGNSQEWHKVALNWADWIVKDLKKRGIKECWFLGDFFHNRSEISVQTVHVATEIMDKFKDHDMIMIVGNHDAYYKNRADIHSLGLMKGHKNIKIVDTNYETIRDSKKCLFVPWNSELPDKEYDYIFGHFEIQSFKMNNFKVCDHGLSPMDLLEKRTSKVFSGHFHNRNSKTYKEGDIYYIGNTFPMDFSDEANEKGYHILDLVNDELTFIKNPVSPKYIKVYFSKIDKYEEDDIKNNIIKVVFDEEISLDESEKIKLRLMKWHPFQTFTEFSFSSDKLGEVEQIDSFELSEMFDEFIDDLKPKRKKNIKTIIEELYGKHK